MARYDVIISGYGPTGAVAANLLGQRGLRVLVVDRSAEIFQIPRAIHFDGEVMRVFQHLDLAEEVWTVSGIGTGLAYVNGKGRVLMTAELGDFDMRHSWPPAIFFNQPGLEVILREGVRRFPSVTVRLDVALLDFEQDDDEVRVRIQPAGGDVDVVAARYLLGCDGAGSPTRDTAGLELESLDSDEPWLVCDLAVPDGIKIDRTAYQVCDYRRPTTIVPWAKDRVRWEFMLRPGDDPDHLEDDATARAMMAPHLHRLSPDLRPDKGTLLRRKVYTFHGLVARRWRAGRVMILGDAAHQTPPFLGQGLCAGVRDAFNLCWKLDGVIAGRYPQEILDTYESERRPHARAVVAKAIRIGRVIQATTRIRGLLRDGFFMLTRALPILRRGFAWEPAWPLGPGLFGPDGAPGDDSPHGNPIDQPFVVNAAGERVRLDDLLGREFALVGYDVDPATLLDESTAKILAELGGKCVHVVRERTPDCGPHAVADADGGFAKWLARVGGGRVAVVRPDREVFGLYGRREGADLRAEIKAAAAKLAARLDVAEGAAR